METEHNPYFPVPFSLDQLPEPLRPLVRPAIRDSLQAKRAILAIEEHWEDGGERTPPLLLSYAFLRFVEACEIMVDDQVDEAKRAVELCEEARRNGAPDTDVLDNFESVCREVWEEVEQMNEATYELSFREPHEVPDSEIGMVAHVLAEREEHDRAVPFYRRAIEVKPRSANHYRINLATSLKEAGRPDEARAVWEDIRTNRDAITDGWAVSAAYVGLIETGPDASAEAMFAEACAWADAADERFPFDHPSQERLLDLAIRLDSPEMALHVADVIETRRDGTIPRELRTKIASTRNRYT